MATGGDRVRVEVLGPIRVLDGDRQDITPDGLLQRRLLALLVLRRGRVVPAPSAVEALWPSRLPADPAAALQNHMFRLRRGLPHGLIESVGEGYRLDPARVDVDADRLVAVSTAGGTDTAEIDAVLTRWQGPAYPELDDVDEARMEATRLEELRFRVREVRAETRLARGDTDGLVAELTALSDAQPSRERPRALLMTALAATGRRAEALRVYDDFRRLIGDELGIEPSPALAAQHAELLAGAPDRVWAPVGRLPVPATSLVGRDALAAEVTGLTESGRLVTLVGPGGVGKTRLLLEAGHRLRAVRPDRPVVLCELATAEPGSAVDVVAAALRIDARPGTALAERVADVLGETEIVLLLDNCEHVLEPIAAFVERLLGTCANVRVVATSRERLRVVGEYVRRVPTLAYDGEDAPAVRLFEERARAVVPGFEPDGRERACIAEIVRRLDGLPLAIELAAACLHTHEVAEVAAGLDHRFELLASGYRTTPRHGSLAAAVSWSFGLLPEDLRRTFADLSVFAGSFDAADAAAVCGTDPGTTVAALTHLVERSLVMRIPGRRYMLLETLRAFGTEQLVRTGRADTIAERHARHLVDWVDRADSRLLQPGEPVLSQIDAAVPELRSALGWLLDHDEIALAGRLVNALLDYGIFRLRPDVLNWARMVIAADPEGRSPFAARVQVVAAYAAWMSGNVPETGRLSAGALRAVERVKTEPAAEALTVRGSYELFEGHLDAAAAWYRRAAAAAVHDPAQRLMARASELLPLGYAGAPAAVGLAATLLVEIGDARTPHAAYVWYCAGEADLAVDVERARARFARALEIAEQTNASFVTGLAGASKASIDARIGDPVAAAAEYRRLIPHWRRAGVWSTQWTMLRSIAGLLERLGRYHDAAVLEGAVRATAAGHRIFGADEVALDDLGVRLRTELGDDEYEAARRRGAMLDGEAAAEHALRAL
ncbi:BTAD domain-containing putative transcriptional regulator [Rhodococcus sp. GXMU-t2271]|uniref:ATP-binding protein n=1 Tax=Rhodococcus sp. GXMU-t2271 TaxID=3059079 RepID=UPI00352B2A71